MRARCACRRQVPSRLPSLRPSRPRSRLPSLPRSLPPSRRRRRRRQSGSRRPRSRPRRRRQSPSALASHGRAHPQHRAPARAPHPITTARSPEGTMTEPSIAERIQAAMGKAMKEKDADTLSTVRMLNAAHMEAKTAKSKDATLSGDEEIEILQRYVKKRRETIEMNTKVGRPDLSPAEEREIAITQ